MQCGPGKEDGPREVALRRLLVVGCEATGKRSARVVSVSEVSCYVSGRESPVKMEDAWRVEDARREMRRAKFETIRSARRL